MKTFMTVACLFLTACCAYGADDAKPTIKVAADGYPFGHDTPEGAACDLARAFIERDTTLFTNTRLRSYGPAEYDEFLTNIIASMKSEAAKAEPSPEGPKTLAKVFAARYLSKNGPASFGYAAYGFQSVMFVDVKALLYNGGHFLCRTLVIKDKDGKWYADPLPIGLLSTGLNDESASQQDFTDVYEVQK
jgi:hypothetical protein